MSKSKDKTFIYAVEGRGPFPLDMLRYDRATPATEGDASLMTRTFDRAGMTHYNFIRLRSDREPTAGRWQSFGWTVHHDMRREANGA